MKESRTYRTPKYLTGESKKKKIFSKYPKHIKKLVSLFLIINVSFSTDNKQFVISLRLTSNSARHVIRKCVRKEVNLSHMCIEMYNTLSNY